LVPVIGAELNEWWYAPSSWEMFMNRHSTPREASPQHDENAEWLQTRPGERCRIRTSAADTNGAFSVVEIISQPGDGTPVHIHRNEDEHFIILEGTARFLYGEKIFDAPAGTSVSASRNIPHAWCNPFNAPFRMVAIAAPGGCEEALRVIARGGDTDLLALAARLGVEVVGPPMLAPRSSSVVG
jgi:mannose-6-phosphate isomerase-like protein (cupin superfamily)